MRTKYADLISQMELATKSYEAALAAVKAFESTTRELPDVAGVSGKIIFLEDKYEKCRAIQLVAKKFAEVALDYGSDFTLEDRVEYTRVECTMFGYRVFCLAVKGSAEEVFLMDLLAAEEERK